MLGVPEGARASHGGAWLRHAAARPAVAPTATPASPTPPRTHARARYNAAGEIEPHQYNELREPRHVVVVGVLHLDQEDAACHQQQACDHHPHNRVEDRVHPVPRRARVRVCVCARGGASGLAGQARRLRATQAGRGHALQVECRQRVLAMGRAAPPWGHAREPPLLGGAARVCYNSNCVAHARMFPPTPGAPPPPPSALRDSAPPAAGRRSTRSSQLRAVPRTHIAPCPRRHHCAATKLRQNSASFDCGS